jgi:hypothetical protein
VCLECAGDAEEETVVEIHHTQKSLLQFEVCGFRKIQNDLDVVPEGGDAGGGDAVAQEIQLGDSEHALLQLEGQPIGSKDGKQRAEVGPVQTPSSSKKENT